MKLNTVQNIGSEVATTGKNVLQGMRHLAQHGSAKIAAAALTTIAAISCSEDGRVYGDTDTATSETGTDTSSGRGAADAGSTDAGSTDAAADLAGDATSTLDAGATPASDTAATDTSDAPQNDSADAADTTAADAAVPDAAVPDSSSNLPETTVVGGFDAATGADAATADTSTDVQTVQSKFWNSHPNASKDEKLLGCDSDELPSKQVIVPGGSYQIVKIPAGKTGLVDMAPDLNQNLNGAQAYNVPSSEFPVNKDGQAYRIVALQMQSPDLKVGTNLISVKKGTGELDRMPLFAVRSKVGQHAFDIASSVKATLAEDKFATLSDVHDALAQKLPTDKFQVQGIVPGTPGKSDGQTFAGKEKGVVWVMPVANAQCTE